jgi:hypothetical protein
MAAPAAHADDSPVVSPQELQHICGWLRDPAWTMPQIVSSTGDMLANDNTEQGYAPHDMTPEIVTTIARAITTKCPDANWRTAS